MMYQYFLYWINSSNYQRTLEEMKNSKDTLLAMGHLEIKGFEMNHNMNVLKLVWIKVYLINLI